MTPTIGKITPIIRKYQRKIFEYFGTFTRSILSMFEMTLANWPTVCRTLGEEVSEWFVLFCLLHKILIGSAAVGIINGVFMQETFKVASTDDQIMVRQNKRAAEVHRNKMLTLFDLLDSSHDGSIGPEEFLAIGHIPEVKFWLASMDLETDDLSTLFRLLDANSSGKINGSDTLV